MILHRPEVRNALWGGAVQDVAEVLCDWLGGGARSIRRGIRGTRTRRRDRAPSDCEAKRQTAGQTEEPVTTHRSSPKTQAASGLSNLIIARGRICYRIFARPIVADCRRQFK